MKLKYGNQSIDLFDKKVPDHVLLAVSGGLDSASLFYLICKNFPQVKVTPYTGRDVTAPFDYECALDIIQFMRETFPDNDIVDHEVFTFDINDPEWRKLAEDKWDEEMITMPDGSKVGRALTISGLVKILMKRKHEGDLLKKYPDALMVTGMTGNPPIEEQKKYGFYDVAERRRDNKNQNPWKFVIYQPYINIDKKFVAGVYKEHNLMDTLYTYTSSCVGFPEETNYYSEPCGQCFWCHEKKWAFET